MTVSLQQPLTADRTHKDRSMAMKTGLGVTLVGGRSIQTGIQQLPVFALEYRKLGDQKQRFPVRNYRGTPMRKTINPVPVISPESDAHPNDLEGTMPDNNSSIIAIAGLPNVHAHDSSQSGHNQVS